MSTYSDERTYKGYTTIVHEVHAQDCDPDCDACHEAMWAAIDAGRSLDDIEAAGNNVVPSWAKFGHVSAYAPEGL